MKAPTDASIKAVMSRWARLGGKARAKALPAWRRKEIARAAAKASARVRSRKAKARRKR